jgi:hypothetical protein
VNVDRRARLWSEVMRRACGEPVLIDHVCAAAIRVAGVDTAAIAVALAATPRETIYAADRLASGLEELALILGEGPGIDAGAGTPMLVADLTAEESLRRWPVFAPAATDAGVHAVFALPLQIGAVRLGVMSLYRVRAGELGRDRLADALELADTACAVLLDTTQRSHPDPGDNWSERATARYAEVHQATGMISVQLEVTVAAALVRLRAYAYAHERPLRDVARDVVNRRLRFEPDREVR